MATILVADDRPENRRFLRQLLGERGHAVVEAADGVEALQRAQARRPDLVIADIVMPVMDGFEFVKRLRADAALGRVPVLFFTATDPVAEALSLAAACGVFRVLTKPCHPTHLLRVVEEALARTDAASPTPVPPEFDQEHLRLLTNTLSAKVDELETLGRKLTDLLELGQQLALEPDRFAVLRRVCQSARRLLGAEGAGVGLLDPDGRLSPHLTSTDELPEATEGDPLTTQTAWLAEVLKRRRPVRLFTARYPLGTELQPVLAVPMASPTALHGVLYLVGPVGPCGFGEHEEQTALTLATQAAVAYENALRRDEIGEHVRRLEREVAERSRVEEELWRNTRLLHKLSQQLIQTQENERRHLARELHDEIGQNLSLLKINLHRAQRSADVAATAALLHDSTELVELTLKQVRNLSVELRPSLLDTSGLEAALRWHLDRQAQRTGLDIRLTADPEGFRAPATVENVCFRVVQESLTNVIRHARAARVDVTIRGRPDSLDVTVSDDGVGFDVRSARQRAALGGSLGLVGMEERVAMAGGNLSMKSAPGRGTTVRAWFPLEPAEAGPGGKP